MDKKPKVISIIKGGLGNQLFIYAAGRAFADRIGAEHLIDGKRGYTHDSYGRRFLLKRFPIESSIMPEKLRIAPTLKHFRHKFLRTINKYLQVDHRNYLAESHGIHPDLFNNCSPSAALIYLNGHWNDERFFESSEVRLRRELKLPEPKSEVNLAFGALLRANPESVFIHIRRVRYETKLTAYYYKTAIEGITSALENPNFVVFADDMEWAKANLPSCVEYTWVENNADDEMADMWLMSCCQHAIIANSGFSWWGAWLGEAERSKRIIYAPESPNWHMRAARSWRTLAFEV